MRRRSDSWVNATQVLKVAEFDKPQRTRILEREVQRGVHEKVQGGYGKYQGTWVPLERAKEIAALYNVGELLKPIFEFRPSTESPPLAPKHVTAASTKPRPARAPARNAAATAPAKRAVKPPPPPVPVPAPPSHVSSEEDEIEEDDLSDIDPLNDPSSPSIQSSSASEGDLSELELDDPSQHSLNTTLKRKREHMDHEIMSSPGLIHSSQQRRMAYSDELLDYFMANEKGLPDFLINPPPDFDVNEIIDDEGHTAFHWAAAMGDLRVIELLYKANANIYMVNKRGETPLIRAVLFTNNYDQKSFPRLVETLRDTIFHVDNYNSTVFHHIAATTSSRNKLLAARYYYDVLLQKLGEKHSMAEIARVLDLRDTPGDTALTIAARNGAKKCVRSLLAHNANPNIANNEGQTADQYIVAVERQRRNGDYPLASSSSPFQSHDNHMHHQHHNPRYQRHPSTQSAATVAAVNYANASHVPRPHISEAAISATKKIIPQMAEMLEGLATAFDNELQDKEEDVSQAQRLLDSSTHEIQACKATSEETLAPFGDVATMEHQIDLLKAEAENLAEELKKIFERGQYYELSNLVRQEEQQIEDDKEPLANADDPDNLMEKLEAARQLAQAQREREELREIIIKAHARSGAGEKMSDYRRLIALSCSLLTEDVEDLLPEILKDLEAGGDGDIRDGLMI
ncbi:apses-domain-containing protein [Morchella conica CCBAS932]|uniref:Apses-domain-containing protein n=1 Tax=Morchella conica CCBAS932 TaxID=1392247 RepID=A0A3N4KNR5_9PEZI|nr:apses-domain-containing protein [Morchella conica CCBAS932]